LIINKIFYRFLITQEGFILTEKPVKWRICNHSIPISKKCIYINLSFSVEKSTALAVLFSVKSVIRRKKSRWDEIRSADEFACGGKKRAKASEDSGALKRAPSSVQCDLNPMWVADPNLSFCIKVYQTDAHSFACGGKSEQKRVRIREY